MRVAVWGAGEIGRAAAYRLSSSCTLGRDGVLQRHTELLEHEAVRPELEACLSALRQQVEREL